MPPPLRDIDEEFSERTPMLFESKEESLSHKEIVTEHQTPMNIEIEDPNASRTSETKSHDRIHEKYIYFQDIISKIGGSIQKDAKVIIQSLQIIVKV